MHNAPHAKPLGGHNESHDLTVFSESGEIRVLRHRLTSALERETRLAVRNEYLELEMHRLRERRSARGSAHEYVARMRQQLRCAYSELAQAKADVVAIQARSSVLDDLVHALLVTLERAAIGAAQTEAAPATPRAVRGHQ